MCSGDAPTTCALDCGDGARVGNEGCDDNNVASGDGCSSNCTVEEGWECSGDAPSSCLTVARARGTWCAVCWLVHYIEVVLCLLACGSV